MTKSGLSKSTRKFIRKEKARIRASVLDSKKQEEMISELYNKFIVDKSDAKISIDNQNIENGLSQKPNPPAGGQISSQSPARADALAGRQNPKSKISAKKNKTKKQKLKSKK